MATLTDKISVRAGVCPANTYAPAGAHGDWVTYHVPFEPPLPAAAEGQVRVVASASDAGGDINVHQAAPVPVVGEISPQGFTAWMRNSDVTGGDAGLNWLAVAEVPDTAAPIAGAATPAPKLRFGTLQPQHFQVNGYRGDWRRWAVNYGASSGFTDIPVTVLTTTNDNVRVHAAASVGICAGASKNGVNVAARNSDVTAGASNFNFVAAQQLAGGSPDLLVDSGVVPPRYFEVVGTSGDWQVWNVGFNEPFLTAPVVLLSANDAGGSMGSYARAALGSVFDPSADGFTLAARNSDLCAGPAGFTWVAVGRPGF